MLKDKILSIHGKNIKKYNVQINDSEIIIPVVPTHKNDIKPEFELASGYTVELDGDDIASGVNAVLTSSDGEKTEFTVKAVEWVIPLSASTAFSATPASSRLTANITFIPQRTE